MLFKAILNHSFQLLGCLFDLVDFCLFLFSAAVLLLLFAVDAMVDLAVDPHKFTHLAIWMSVGSLAVTDVVSELALVDLSVCPDKFSPAVLDVFEILALKYISIVSFPLAFSLSFAFNKLAFIDTAIFPSVSAQSTELAIFKLACVGVSIYQFFITIAMFQILLYFSLVVESIFGQNDCFSCLLSHLEISYVFSVFLVDVSAKSVRFSVRPVAIISHEVISMVCIYRKYFNCSLAMSHSIFEISQINVFIWNIFKAKTILLALSWQIDLPISEIESATVVPDYVFTCIQLKVKSIFELPRDDLLLLSVQFYSKECEYLRSQFFILLEFLSHFWCLQWKVLWYLQFVNDFLSEVIFYFCDLPLWDQLFPENNSTVRFNLNLLLLFLYLFLNFLRILFIFLLLYFSSQCLGLKLLQLFQILSLTFYLTHHCFTHIFLFNTIT